MKSSETPSPRKEIYTPTKIDRELTKPGTITFFDEKNAQTRTAAAGPVTNLRHKLILVARLGNIQVIKNKEVGVAINFRVSKIIGIY